MQREFYSNGKLLLSGEYAILDGALGLAVPTVFGQYLKVTNQKSNGLHWRSYNETNQVWFEAKFDLKNWTTSTATDTSKAKTLIKILSKAQELNPEFLTTPDGLSVETKLTFPTNWGLGSSSTLINNIAQWANIDAHQLLWMTLGGSGYDISCAQHDGSILFKLEESAPRVKKVQFAPPFKDKLFFVYLNKKQDSQKAIIEYRKSNHGRGHFVDEISELTKELLNAASLVDFELAMEKHETLLSKILKIEPIKSALFDDFPGSIKSLGAWGGDFILATGTQEKTPGYFKSKGFETLLSYGEMVL